MSRYAKFVGKSVKVIYSNGGGTLETAPFLVLSIKSELPSPRQAVLRGLFTGGSIHGVEVFFPEQAVLL